MTLQLAIFAVILLFTAVLLHAAPAMSRRDIFFGATVAPEFPNSPEAASIRRTYRAWIWTGTLAIAALIRLAPNPVIRATIPVFGLLAVGFIAWARANRSARCHSISSPSVRSAALTRRDDPWPGGILFSLGPYLILAAAGWFIHAHWDSIPDSIPVHWDIAGRPNAFAPRSVAIVYRPLILGVLSCLTILGSGWFVFRRTRQVETTEPAASRERDYKRSTVLWLTLLSYTMAALFAFIAIRAHTGSNIDVWQILLLTVAPLGIAGLMVWKLGRAGQAGDRLATGPEAGATPGDATPDDCWRAGMFYYNPNDPALFVEKRMGIGWTLNFANRLSWVFLFVVLFAPLLVTFLLR